MVCAMTHLSQGSALHRSIGPRSLVALLLLAATGSILPASAQAQAQAQPASTICEFKSGPRTGERMRLRGELATLPVGSPCSDGQGSSGVVVNKDATADGPTPAGEKRLSSTCEFTIGVRSGQRMRGVTPSRIGAPCADREGNHGFIVEEAPPSAKANPTLGGIPKQDCRPNLDRRLPPICRNTP